MCRMHHSASFSAVLRVHLEDVPGTFGRLAAAIGEAGGLLDAIDLVRVEGGEKVRDVTVLADNAEHMDAIADAVRAVPGIWLEHVSDRTFLMHLGGKIEVMPKTPVKTRDDLSMAYTPGVARVSSAIAEDAAKVWTLTIKANTVAVVTDGTAVLGLGDVGPEAALPVMEGKAMLFKEFAGIDAFPICLDTTDPDEIVAAVKAIAPVFGGINLEDIAAPHCFEVERRLREELDIPVFHDDQHGTAVVVLAALLNALRLVGKRLEDAKVVVVGCGAAGTAIAHLLLAAGARNVVGCDVDGALVRGTAGLSPAHAALAELTNPDLEQGGADDVLAGADAVIGVSRPGAFTAAGVARMAGERDRVRDGEPDARGAAERRRRSSHDRRHRALRLPEPDQQRPCVPGHVPRRAGRPRLRGDDRDGARRGARDRGRDPARRARPGLRRAERLQPGRRARGREGGRRGGGAGRRRPEAPGRRAGRELVAQSHKVD